jgi:hypothetical protein
MYLVSRVRECYEPKALPSSACAMSLSSGLFRQGVRLDLLLLSKHSVPRCLFLVVYIERYGFIISVPGALRSPLTLLTSVSSLLLNWSKSR